MTADSQDDSPKKQARDKGPSVTRPASTSNSEKPAEKLECAEISKEFRRPLSAIRGALGLLEGGHMGHLSQDALKMIAVARSSTDDLARLINDLVELEKMESGRVEPEFETIDLKEILSMSVSAVSGMAAEAGVGIRLEMSASWATVRGNRDRLVQVTVHLIQKAISETSRGEAVSVVLEQIPDRVRIAVTDGKRTGRLELGQSGSAIAERTVSAVIKQHKGTAGEEYVKSDVLKRWIDLPVTGTGETVAFVPGQTPVLLVEDEDQLCRFISIFLGKEGYDVRRAASIEQARLMLQELRPVAVLADVHLPDGNGLDFLKEIRQRPALAGVPFLVLSGRDRTEFERNMPENSGWLMKPFGHAQLIAKLREITGNTLH